MKKAYLGILAIVEIGFTSCNNTTTKADKKIEKETVQKKEVTVTAEAYQLMHDKCSICHFEKPSIENKDKMVAPPILRMKEHYLPVYPKKEDFVKAIVDYTKNPLEENTLMPGTIKKYNLMPKLIYDDDELRIIAETIYDYDFGKAPEFAKAMHGKLQLNDEKKWQVKKETVQQVNELIKKIDEFKSDNIAEYNKFGKELFDQAKSILLDKEYQGALFDQIHTFFNGIEEGMHNLMSDKNVSNAQQNMLKLKKQLSKFHDYFKAM